MIIFVKILHFATILLSGGLVMQALSQLIKISEKRLRRLVLFLGCSLLCSMIIFIGDPFNILGTTPVFLAIVLLTCEGSLWQKLTIGLMFSSTVFSFSALRDNYIHDLLFPQKKEPITVIILGGSDMPNFLPDTLAQNEQDYRVACLFTLPFALALYLYTRKFAPDKDYSLSDSMWRLLLLLTVIPLGIVLTVVTLFPLSDSYADIFAHREYAILLLIALLAFVSLLWCVTVLAKQRKLEQQNMFAEINRKYYEAMEQQHFEVRRLKHDLANHMQVLSALPEEKREAYARELAGSAAFSQSVSYCADSTVNAVLTVKNSVMERHHIRLQTDLDIPEPLPYDKMDVCALFANALDNATEACMKLEESLREITLKARTGKGLFCLEINNPLTDPEKQASLPRWQTSSFSSEAKQIASFAGKTRTCGTLPPTSKPDKAEHGFGLQSIRDIVKRYSGHMEIRTENGVFDLFLYLPLTAR